MEHLFRYFLFIINIDIKVNLKKVDNYIKRGYELKLSPIYRRIKEDIDPKAQASANALLLMDKLRTNPGFMKMLQEIQLPSDKYKAIMKFADLLGIPEERFADFVQQQENQQ